MFCFAFACSKCFATSIASLTLFFPKTATTRSISYATFNKATFSFFITDTSSRNRSTRFSRSRFRSDSFRFLLFSSKYLLWSLGRPANSLLLVYSDSSSWCSATVEYRKVLFPATSFSKNMGESFFLQYAFSSARYYI